MHAVHVTYRKQLDDISPNLYHLTCCEPMNFIKIKFNPFKKLIFFLG